ncbi:hypothetical protein GGE06_007572 [Streptomyces sp. SFB5A]|uniref:Uncharacterized protein n=1 Tax=Streptomyces nymphaeiformis TaxID=2663842 RepID=A0A7W7U806_9ACTN|nr:hypothetical protein [Streptomyces nymphaeiformis]
MDSPDRMDAVVHALACPAPVSTGSGSYADQRLVACP